MNFLKARFGNSFAQDFLAADIANDVEGNASQRRSHRGQNHIEQEMMAVFIHISSDYGIDRHTQKRRICEGHDEWAPNSQRPQQSPDPRRVARQNVPNGFQKDLVYVVCRTMQIRYAPFFLAAVRAREVSIRSQTLATAPRLPGFPASSESALRHARHKLRG